MESKIIYIDISPENNEDVSENGGVMWEHNATVLKFNINSEFVGDYRYYLEYRSLIGTKVRTEYLELNKQDNTVTYNVPVSMTSLRGVECYFNIISIDEDGNTAKIIKPKKISLTFDYSPDTDNSLAKINDFSINYLLEAIRLGVFKGDKGEKGDTGVRGEKGEKGDTGEISEDFATKTFANAIKGKLNDDNLFADDVSPIAHPISIKFTSAERDDYSTVNVTVCGKNLIDVSAFELNKTVQGAGAGSVCTPSDKVGYAVLWHLPVRPDTTYTFSLDNSIYWLDRICEMGNDDMCAHNNAYYVNTKNDYSEHTFTTTPNTAYLIVRLYNKNGEEVTQEDLSQIKIQFELGEKATEYAEYCGATIVANSDGTVSNCKSVSPYMTVIADKSDVNFECDYNKDTNKIIEKIIAAITALGGTVN